MEDRREQRTKARLRAVILELVEQKSLTEITVTEIAERADIARKTFYAHYYDVQELLWDSAANSFDELSEALMDLNPSSLLADGKPLSYPVFAHVEAHRNFYRFMLSEEGSAGFIMRLLHYLADASYRHHAPLRDVSQRISVPPRYINYFLAGGIISSIVWWLEQDEPPSALEMAYRFSQLAAPGVLSVMGLD